MLPCLDVPPAPVPSSRGEALGTVPLDLPNPTSRRAAERLTRILRHGAESQTPPAATPTVIGWWRHRY